MVELLIVIGVIGVLATGILVLLNPVTQLQKANDARRKSDLSQIQKALEIYYNDNGEYPEADTGQRKIKDINGMTVDWGTAGFTPYMQVLSKDPSSPTKEYAYDSPSPGQSYYLYASLDRAGNNNDAQACFPLTGAPCPYADTNGFGTACGGNCSYGVTSPNVSP